MKKREREKIVHTWINQIETYDDNDDDNDHDDNKTKTKPKKKKTNKQQTI